MSLRRTDAPAAIDWLQRGFGFDPIEVHDGFLWGFSTYRPATPASAWADCQRDID